MAKKIALLVLTTAAFVGALVGYLFWRHGATSAQQKREAAERVRHLPADALTQEDACWVARDHFLSGRGLAGRTPIITCEDPLREVPNGYRLRVRTASAPMKGRLGRDLCLARGTGWTVVGEAYQLDDCLHLPAPGEREPVTAASAEIRRRLARRMTEARAAIVVALAAVPPAETCGTLPRLDVENTPVIDERLLDPAFVPPPGLAVLVPGDTTIVRCAEGAKADALTDVICRGDRPWTHALVVRVHALLPPKVDDAARTYSGGLLSGELWLVELAGQRPLCRRPFTATMPKVISAHTQNLAFGDAVKKTLADAAKELTGFALVR